jgi:methyl-accepting chemotaxis protein
MSDRTQRQLRTLSTGLVVYGIVGIVLTVILLGVSLTLGSRLEGLSSRLSDRLDTISLTVDKAATTLDRAGSTSGSFSTTIDQAVTTVGAVDTTLGEVVATVRELQTTAATLSILGQTPLTSLADRFGRVAGQVESLQAQVSTLGANLATNQSNLAALGTSMTDLAIQLHQVSDVLRSGEIEDSLREIVSVVRWTLGLLAIWFAVPAVAALAFGVWIRRQLAAETVTPAAPPV